MPRDRWLASAESCLAFGMIAEHGMRLGRSRAISCQAEEAGLVLQPTNAKDSLFICTCCGMLRSVKRHPRPTSAVSSPFVATLNAETCEGCGTWPNSVDSCR